MEGGEIKDISLIIINLLSELIEILFGLKIVDEIRLAIRLIIGCSIHLVEISYTLSRNKSSTNEIPLILFISPTISIFVLSITYFIGCIYNRKDIKNFNILCSNSFSICNKISSVSFILSVCLKVLSVLISIMIIVIGSQGSNNTVESRFFVAYGIIDLVLSVTSLIRSLIQSIVLKICCKSEDILPMREIEIDQSTIKIESVKQELDESRANKFQAFALCFHLLILPFKSNKHLKLTLEAIKRNDTNMALIHFKKSKFYNRLFQILLAVSTLGLAVGLGFALSGVFLKSKNCDGVKPFFDIETVYVYFNPSVKTLAICEKDGWMRVQFGKLEGRSSEEIENGFIDLGFSNTISPLFVSNNNYWIGLNNFHYLSEQKNYLLSISTSFSTIEFDGFKVGDKSTGYKIEFGQARLISGNDTDFRQVFNGMKFSSKEFDRDNDPNNNCALNLKEDWWFNTCTYKPNVIRMKVKYSQ